MPGQRRSEDERGIIFSGILGDLTHEEVDGALKARGFRSVPNGSWAMLEKHYKPLLQDVPGLLNGWIKNPPSLKEMKEMKEHKQS